MGPSFLANLRAQYAAYSDDALLELVGAASEDLVPAAQEVLKAELDRRGLAPGVLTALAGQIDGLPASPVDELVNYVQRLPCPHCGTTRTLLNGFTRRPRGLLVAMFFAPPVRSMRPADPLTAIGCEPCLSRLGANLPFQLQPGQPWEPIPQFVAWVRKHGELLRSFKANKDAVAALLRLDGAAFLQLTGRQG
jgi:hypothetical protein